MHAFDNWVGLQYSALSHDRVMQLAWSLYVYAKISRVITFHDDTICVGGNQTFKTYSIIQSFGLDLGPRDDSMELTCDGSHFIFRWPDVEDLSWLWLEQLGHAFALSDGVEEEEVAPRVLLQVRVLVDPVPEGGEVEADLLSSPIAATGRKMPLEHCCIPFKIQLALILKLKVQLTWPQ